MPQNQTDFLKIIRKIINELSAELSMLIGFPPSPPPEKPPSPPPRAPAPPPGAEPPSPAPPVTPKPPPQKPPPGVPEKPAPPKAPPKPPERVGVGGQRVVCVEPPWNPLGKCTPTTGAVFWDGFDISDDKGLVIMGNPGFHCRKMKYIIEVVCIAEGCYVCCGTGNCVSMGKDDYHDFFVEPNKCYTVSAYRGGGRGGHPPPKIPPR